MRRMHIHMFGGMYPHTPDWHTLGVHLGHLTHNSRFWLVLVLAVLFGLMALAVILVDSGGQAPSTPIYPIFPYVPYG